MVNIFAIVRQNVLKKKTRWRRLTDFSHTPWDPSSSRYVIKLAGIQLHTIQFEDGLFYVSCHVQNCQTTSQNNLEMLKRRRNDNSRQRRLLGRRQAEREKTRVRGGLRISRAVHTKGCLPSGLACGVALHERASPPSSGDARATRVLPPGDSVMEACRL